MLGLDTEKYRFSNDKELERKINLIQEFVKYRIKEKIIDKHSELWKILLEIKTQDISKKRNASEILEKLLGLNRLRDVYQPVYLKSEEAKRISMYAKQKAKEVNKKIGEGVLKRFYRYITAK